MHDALKRLRFWGVKVYSVATGADLTAKTGRVLATVMGLKDETFLGGQVHSEARSSPSSKMRR